MEGSIQGDSRACTDATGAGDDVILGGPGLEAIIGDSFAVCEGGTASGAGGNDFIDPGPDGGSDAIGDHNSFGSAVGTGNDIIIGGSADDYLVGDSSPNVGSEVTTAGNDAISAAVATTSSSGTTPSSATRPSEPLGKGCDQRR